MAEKTRTAGSFFTGIPFMRSAYDFTDQSYAREDGVLHESIAKKLSEMMALPPDVLSEMPVTIIRGREALEVEGCTGILEYEPCLVVLALREDRLTVTGRNLMLADFCERTLTVRGCIASVVFGEEGE